MKRGPSVRPQASEGEAQHGPFCWTGCFGQGETSACIVDDTGRILREVKVASDLKLTTYCKLLRNPAYRLKRIELEAGPLLQWLFSAHAEAGLPVICVETRHIQAVLKAQDGPQRCSRHCADDVGALPSDACEDASRPASRRRSRTPVSVELVEPLLGSTLRRRPPG